MKTSLEKISTLERKLNIEVPVTEVQAAFDLAFKEVQKNAAIKGFRKGKAPLGTIKSLYGDRIKQDVIQDLIQKHYPKAVDEHSLDPIGYPAIEFDEFEGTKDFKFSAEFEVRPEVKITQMEGLEVKAEKLGTTDKFVDETLESWRNIFAQTVPVLEDRPAQKKDVVIIDFASDFELTGTGEKQILDHELELGSGQMIPGFEEGVEGMKVGSTKDVTAKFPNNYQVPELAGQEKIFKITLKAMKKKELPQLDDEFAKKMGQGQTIVELRAKVAEDFTKREEHRIKEDMKSRLMRILAEKNPVSVPKSLLTEQKEMLIKNFEQRLAQQGMSNKEYQEYKEKWDADFANTASFMIQSSFLIDEIAKQNSLFVNKEELDQAMKANAGQMRNQGKALSQEEEGNMRRQMAYKLTEDKVVDFILAKSKIKEVDASELADENKDMM
jgi:trigger factor